MVLPRKQKNRFMTLYNNSASNQRKTWFLMTIFFVVVIALGYFLSYAFDTPDILYLAVIFSVVSSFISYWWSDKIVLSMSRAHELKFEDNKELYRLVENLCISAGLKLPRIYIIDDQAPNAFATGRNQAKSVVAVTTGLLQKLNRTELEGVIAHELSHIGNRDILLATITTVLVGMIVLVADWSSRSMFFGKRDSDSNRNGLIVLVGLLLAILAPLFAQLMQVAISRKREYKADADGALLTRYPEGLAAALEKISSDPNQLKSVNRATAHLYIASPFRGRLSRAFMTHPPIEKRIAALRGMKV
jgi:heat shock protein HtpX